MWTFALVTIGFISLALAALFGLGARAKARLKAQHPPPGERVEIGGGALHFIRQGTGGPVVVIDSGQGDFSLSWLPLLPEIARFTTVIAYDRAGLGWSDPSPRPRTAEVMTAELHALLQAARVPAPYVLVGASLGGLNARLFAHRYPEAVAGLVLVDAAHEEQFTPAPIQAALNQMAGLMPVTLGAFGLLVRSGLAALRPALLPDPGGALAKLPGPLAAQYRAVVAADGHNVAAQAAEVRAVAESHAQVRAARITTLGDLPLRVLRHGQPAPAMASPEVTALLEATFARLQAETATQSSAGRLIVAEHSMHTIHLDQPELVVDAIREVVALARERALV